MIANNLVYTYTYHAYLISIPVIVVLFDDKYLCDKRYLIYIYSSIIVYSLNVVRYFSNIF